MPSPIPVLLMVRELGIGGCERDLAKLARALDPSRFKTYAGCFRPDGIRAGELRQAGIPILEFPVRSLLSPKSFGGARLLYDFLTHEDIRVVHCFDTPTVVAVPPIARLAGVPAVVTSRLWEMKSIPRASRVMARVAEKFAHRIVVNARSTGRLVEEEGTSQERIYLCYNGVDTGVFHPRRGERVAPVRDAGLVVGTVCALRAEKRVDLLIDAFARVRNARPGLRLLIVGSGPMEQAWKQRVQEHQMESQCHFEPTRSEVADWMRSIDIFVTPSDSESFPNALLEAMACGCAVIGSNVGGIPEMIEPESAGQIFQRGNLDELTSKLERAINDDAQRAVWSAQAASRAAQEFSMERCAHRMESLYSTLLGQENKTPREEFVGQS